MTLGEHENKCSWEIIQVTSVTLAKEAFDLKECRSSNKIYFPCFPCLMCVSASAYIKLILHTHCFSQTRNLLTIYICLIPGKCVHQIGCSRKPFLKQTTFNSNYQMDFCHSRRDARVCQNNAQQSFIPRCPTTEITELHKTWRNCNFLLDHLGKKHTITSIAKKYKIVIVRIANYFIFHNYDVKTAPLKQLGLFQQCSSQAYDKMSNISHCWSTYWMAGCLFDKEPPPLTLYSYLLGSKYSICAHILT